LSVAKKKTVAVWLLLATLVLGGGAAAYYSLAGNGTMPAEPHEQASKPPEVKGVEGPDPGKDGTRAGARNFAKNYLQDHAPSSFFPKPTNGARLSDTVYGYWPTRNVEATFDTATHQWTVTGAYRVDYPAGLPYVTVVNGRQIVKPRKEWDCRERDWKLVLAYNPSARAY